MKIILAIIALLNGGWMIFDGIHVLLKGRYFGPEQPGPWSNLFKVIGLNPFSMGIPFIVLGLLWLLGYAAFYLGVSWGWMACVVIAVATLWYLPVGTVLSLLYIGLLIYVGPGLMR